MWSHQTNELTGPALTQEPESKKQWPLGNENRGQKVFLANLFNLFFFSVSIPWWDFLCFIDLFFGQSIRSAYHKLCTTMPVLRKQSQRSQDHLSSVSFLGCCLKEHRTRKQNLQKNSVNYLKKKKRNPINSLKLLNQNKITSFNGTWPKQQFHLVWYLP